MFPQLARFTDLGLLLLRLMVAIVFVSSGWADLKDPEGRSKSIGMSKGLTVLLGIAELACGLGVGLGGVNATCSHRLDPHHVGGHPSQNLRLAHRILG
jgi:uncharacterized membrane protein YphA (DoxX/SURF4 family)